MGRKNIHLISFVICATMTGVKAQAEEHLNVEVLKILNASGSFINLQGQSLFLTSDVKKDTRAGYWFDIGPDPRQPSLVCGSLPGAWDVAVAGDYAFVCDYTNFLSVYKMRDHHWQFTIKLKMPSMTENIIIRGKHAFIANHVAGLTVVDISTPSKPIIVSNFNPQIDCDAIGFWHDTAVLYGHWESRLVLVDVSHPEKPRQVAVYQNAPKTFNQGEMAVDGGFVYCTTINGLVIVNVADQHNPKLAKSVDISGQVSDVIVKDKYAFLAAGSKGILVLDVSDTGAPVQVGYYKTSKGFSASQIAIERTDRVHAASDSDTAYVIYVANSKGAAIALQFRAPARSGGR